MPPLPNSAEESAEKEVKPKKSVRKIEVVALRAGFWKNQRKNEGDLFEVESMEKVGDWMKCLDPVHEKQHLAMAKERKQKAARI